MDKVVKFSYNKNKQLKQKHKDNKPLIDRLDVINKYTRLTDPNYLEELKEELEDGYMGTYADADADADGCANDYFNKSEIKRCVDFQKKTYDIFKKTMYNEGLKIKKIKKSFN